MKDETVKDMNRALINTIKKIQQQKEIAKKRAAEKVSRPAGSFQDIEMTSIPKPKETSIEDYEEIADKKQRRFKMQVKRMVELPRLCAFRMCHDCGQVQPPRTFHCEVCQHCVLKGDHHCFWTGNCIGLRNQKFFL